MGPPCKALVSPWGGGHNGEVSTKPGKVYLVGAGPGDPRLLTLRGKECLEGADVVLYDYLASPELLRHARPTTECICLGRHGTGRIMTQDEVHRTMVDRAMQGKVVVRLKGGDPGIFGRLAEEASALRAANIPFEVVPGITAAIAAGAYAGVTLTHRDESSCVAFIAGRERAGKPCESLDYKALAHFPGTLVFYMGVTTAPEWSRRLIEQGKSPHTPVRLVRRASLPEQQAWNCTLGELADRLAQEEVRPPALCIVGHVVENEDLGEWFTSRPLFGQTVLITRPAHQADSLGDRLTELGARVLYQPAIEIAPPSDPGPLDQAIDHLDRFQWLVFSSRNGVEYFLQRLFHRGLDLRALAHCRLATIGPATSAALREYHLVADLEPQEYRAESLAAELEPLARGQNFLLLRASRGREVLAESLTAAGGHVEQVVVYDSRDISQPDPEIAQTLAAGEIGWATVTSSAIARSLVGMFGQKLTCTRLASISPLTAGVLEELGFTSAAIASEYTSEGLVAALMEKAAAAPR